MNFAAAFPSFRHRWVHRVLEIIGVCDCMRRLIAALHRDLRTTLVFNVEEVGSIGITTGIRPGCPLSGTLLALAVDPLARAHCSGPSRVSLVPLRHRILQQLLVLQRWREALGIRLQERQCVFCHLTTICLLRTPCWTDWGSLARLRLRRRPHIGVQVGIAAKSLQWTEVAAKVERRALDVKASSQSLGACIRLYNSHLASMLHRGRFAERAMQRRGSPRRLGWPSRRWS